MSLSNRKTYFLCAIVLLVLTLFFLSAMLHQLKQYEGNYSGFLHISKRFAARTPFIRNRHQLKNRLIITEKGGYDGMQFYSMAFDPFLLKYKDNPRIYKTVVDSTRLRYSRIGFPLLTKLLAADIPRNFPRTMILLIVAFFSIGAFFLVKIALFFGRSPAWALTYTLVPGFFSSLYNATPEPIAAALLLAGIYFYLKDKFVPSACVFSLSLLFRETGIIIVLLLAMYELLYRKKRRSALVLSLSLLPAISWRIYLFWRLFDVFGWRGIASTQRILTYPYAGILELYGVIQRGEYWPELVVPAIVFPLLVTVMLVLGAISFRERKDPISAGLVVYCLLTISLRYDKTWLAVGNGERTSYELFLMFLVLFLSLPLERKRLRIACIGLIAVLFVYSYYFGAAHDMFRSGFQVMIIREWIKSGFG